VYSYLRAVILVPPILWLVGCGFAASGASEDVPGCLLGFWHGLLAPWSLILRAILDIKTYAFPNSGWGYDFGFIVGVILSLFPPGWIAVVIALTVHVLTRVTGA
jgi:hypothetical protein